MSLSKEPDPDDTEDEPEQTATEEDTDTDGPSSRAGMWDEDDERLHMDVARVYEHTLVQLGEVLGEASGVGAVQMTDD